MLARNIRSGKVFDVIFSRRAALIAFVALGFVVTGAFLLLRPDLHSQYNGHSADYWLNIGSFDSLDEIGTNALPPLIDALADPDSLHASIHSWFYARCPRSIKQLLHPPRYNERASTAYHWLLTADISSAVPRLIEVTKDGSPHTRQMTLDLLKRRSLDYAQFTPVFVQCLDDPTSTVRADALWILAEIGKQASNAAPQILKCLSDTNIEVKVQAAHALFKVTGQTNAAVPIMRNNFASRGLKSETRPLTIEWLLEMQPGSDVALDFYRSMLQRTNENVRIEGCYQLEMLREKGRSLLGDLQLLTNDPSPRVQRAAHDAIKAITKERNN